MEELSVQFFLASEAVVDPSVSPLTPMEEVLDFLSMPMEEVLDFLSMPREVALALEAVVVKPSKFWT